MEKKPKTRRSPSTPKNMKTNLCLPRFRTTSAATCGGRISRRVTPMSLLDRLREAVFRLIMFSAISKSTQVKANNGCSDVDVGGDHDKFDRPCYYSYRQHEPHHSEAVADCIEFIKKSSTGFIEDRRHPTASSSVHDGVLPVPVMY